MKRDSVRGRRWLLGTGLLAGGMAVAVPAGCGGVVGGPAVHGSGRDDAGRLHRQAREALDRYDAAVRDAGGVPRFVPVGALTGQRGDWEATNGDNKLKLASGQVAAAGPLPAAPRPTGEVVWESGTRLELPVLSAEDALQRLRAAGTHECGDCVPMQVTAARPITVRIATTRGPATVPAWEYTVAGTAVRLTRVAVDDAVTVRVTPPSWDPDNAPGGLAIESATSTGTRLTVTFTGSPDPASRPCGADYTAEAVESATAVVVIVLTRPHSGDEACGDVGARRTAEVELARPLGERAVLEVQQGLPVPVTITG